MGGKNLVLFGYRSQLFPAWEYPQEGETKTPSCAQIMRAIDITQLIECVSSMKEILGLILSSIKSGMAEHIYNPSTQVVEA